MYSNLDILQSFEWTVKKILFKFNAILKRKKIGPQSTGYYWTPEALWKKSLNQTKVQMEMKKNN